MYSHFLESKKYAKALSTFLGQTLSAVCETNSAVTQFCTGISCTGSSDTGSSAELSSARRQMRTL